jgi:hypothetical protein
LPTLITAAEVPGAPVKVWFIDISAAAPGAPGSPLDILINSQKEHAESAADTYWGNSTILNNTIISMRPLGLLIYFSPKITTWFLLQ